MNRDLARRCVIVTLIAMTLALAIGLLAWGPIPLGPEQHSYADTRRLGAMPNAVNALTSLLLVLSALWGAASLSIGAWPIEVTRPLQLFFVVAASAATLGALYHLRPDDAGYVVAQLLMAAGFTLLLAGFLAERVDARFGTRSACIVALLLPMLAGFWCIVFDWMTGQADLRALILLQTLPVLVVAAGAIALPGRVTRKSDWLAMLALYGVAKLFDIADEQIYGWTGWVSGHSLMHITFAAIAAWLAYRAARSTHPADAGTAGVSVPSSQRTTSLNTSG